jgi:hypothetical protein
MFLKFSHGTRFYAIPRQNISNISLEGYRITISFFQPIKFPKRKKSDKLVLIDSKTPQETFNKLTNG